MRISGTQKKQGSEIARQLWRLGRRKWGHLCSAPPQPAKKPSRWRHGSASECARPFRHRAAAPVGAATRLLTRRSGEVSGAQDRLLGLLSLCSVDGGRERQHQLVESGLFFSGAERSILVPPSQVAKNRPPKTVCAVTSMQHGQEFSVKVL